MSIIFHKLWSMTLLRSRSSVAQLREDKEIHVPVHGTFRPVVVHLAAREEDVDVESLDEDVDVESLDEDVDVESFDEDVDIESFDGDVAVESFDGDVDGQFVDEDVDIESVDEARDGNPGRQGVFPGEHSRSVSCIIFPHLSTSILCPSLFPPLSLALPTSYHGSRQAPQMRVQVVLERDPLLGKASLF